MAALFDPNRHEPLVIEAWNESEARRCIEEIVAGAIDGYSPAHLYPPHPLDDMLSGPSAGTSPYFGAMGVFWGVAYLSAAGVVHDRRDWVRQRLDAMVDSNAGSSFAEGSLLLGPLPALALRARLQPLTAAADRDAIHAALLRAAAGPVLELMWGIPGGAALAEQLLRETGEPRWQTLLRKQLDAIWDARVDLPGIGLLWDEELYGARNRYLGAVHGFAGQALLLLRAFTLLSAERRASVRGAIARTLDATAVRDGKLVNWPTVAAPAEPPVCLVQYCHGAPGMIACFAGVSSDALPGIDDVLLGGGELVWHAGPLAKGSNLCHGTAGNGLAFVKLFACSGDGLWLDRARAFAMHAIRQYRRAKRRYGRDRFSLFTGDIGVAVYLRACIDEVAAMPLVDVL
jgi:hypothetical protein